MPHGSHGTCAIQLSELNEMEGVVPKGQEKPGKTNKPKLSVKAKQAKKAEKKAGKA